MNECEEIKFVCGLDGICLNTNGSFDCVCPEGQTPNPIDGRCEGKEGTGAKTLLCHGTGSS